jgi:hypothetical protein
MAVSGQGNLLFWEERGTAQYNLGLHDATEKQATTQGRIAIVLC